VHSGGMFRGPAWLSPELPLLDQTCPLPLEEPFTRALAHQLGVTRGQFDQLLARGLVRPVVRGVFVTAQAVDTIRLRASALALVVPPSAIVTDLTAAWLHGVDLLPGPALYEMPPLQIFGRTGSRLRRPAVSSGTRRMLDSDVTVVDGVLVTTKLRTALDLGRLLRRSAAFAALDAMLRAGVERESLLAQVERFKGDRGVVQLRTLAPLADPRAESPPESILRLHWIDASLPAPDLQVWVPSGDDRRFRIDLGREDLRYGVEYDGRAYHGEDRTAHDLARRSWLEEQEDWLIDVFVAEDLFAPNANPQARLREGCREARRRRGRWMPESLYLREVPRRLD
jgi:hypothetical protein